MKIKPRQSRSGVALIIVMISVVSLSILAGIFAFRMKVEARLAMNSNNDASMDWMARSAAEMAKLRLGLEMQAGCPDSRGSLWAGGLGVGCPGLSNAALETLPFTYPLGRGDVTIGKMVDHERKANINAANEEMLEQALLLMGVDAGEYPVIVNSILDWIDPDDAERPQGAESDFYGALEDPYRAKDGPIDDLSELLLVEGITLDIYDAKYAGLGGGRTRRDSSRRLGFEADVPVYPVGFVQLFTPISAGRININTAGVEVLQLLPGVDEHAANEIIRLRAGLDGADGTDDDIPFRNPGEIINAGLNPGLVQRVIPMCEVRSRTFEVPITVRVGGYTRSYQATILRNNPRDLQVISFQPTDNAAAPAPAEVLP
jgi:type II secretory pathway component PulK